MYVFLLILMLAGALLALVAGLAALRAWLRLRRARLAAREQLSDDMARLLLRTEEVEEKIRVLDARAGALPVRIQNLHQNLATLRVLTGALATSLRQARRALSYDLLRSSASARIADLLQKQLSQALKKRPTR